MGVLQRSTDKKSYPSLLPDSARTKKEITMNINAKFNLILTRINRTKLISDNLSRGIKGWISRSCVMSSCPVTVLKTPAKRGAPNQTDSHQKLIQTMGYAAHHSPHSQGNPIQPGGIFYRTRMVCKLDPVRAGMARQPFLLRRVRR